MPLVSVQRRRAFRTFFGLCAQCGALSRPKRKLCQRCADSHLRVARAWRQRKRAEGRCVMCGKPTQGMMQCPEHLQINNKEKRKVYLRNVREGRCCICGRPVPEDRIGLKTCGCDDIGRTRKWS